MNGTMETPTTGRKIPDDFERAKAARERDAAIAKGDRWSAPRAQGEYLGLAKVEVPSGQRVWHASLVGDQSNNSLAQHYAGWHRFAPNTLDMSLEELQHVGAADKYESYRNEAVDRYRAQLAVDRVGTYTENGGNVAWASPDGDLNCATATEGLMTSLANAGYNETGRYGDSLAVPLTNDPDHNAELFADQRSRR